MLAVDPSAQRSGVGRRMVDFVEDLASGMGMDVMELGVVVPVQGVLESKVFLMEWYRRLGYREVKRVSFDESLPATERAMLVVECEYVVFEKELA